MISDQRLGPSSRETNAGNFNSTHSVSRELYSLLDAVDSESIADQFDIGKYSSTHDFDNHLKIAVREGLDPSTSLAELADNAHVKHVVGESEDSSNDFFESVSTWFA